MTNEEILKQKYLEFQGIQEHIEKISEHLQMFNQQTQELELSKEALEEIGKAKLDNEVLCPIANGIFIKAVLKDNQKLVVNVGADTSVEKTVPQVIEMLEKQKQDMMKKVIEGEMMLQQMHQHAMKMYQEIEKM